MKVDPNEMTPPVELPMPRSLFRKRLIIGCMFSVLVVLGLAIWIFSWPQVVQGQHGIAAIGRVPASTWIPRTWIPRRLRPWLERPTPIKSVTFHTNNGDPLEGMRRLGTRPSVRSVRYSGHFHGPEMLPRMAQTFPSVQDLQIRETSPLTPDDCRAIQQKTELRTISLGTPVEPGGFAELGRHPNAKQIYWIFTLKGTSEQSIRELAEMPVTRLYLVVSPSDFLAIAKGIESNSFPFPGLQYLTVNCGSRPTVQPVSPEMNASMKSLARLPRLTHLSLSNCGIDDSGVQHLESMSGLQSLDLAHSLVTDVGCRSLSKLTNLHALNLGDSQITIAGVHELKTLTNMRALRIKLCPNLPPPQANLTLPPELSKGNVQR